MTPTLGRWLVAGLVALGLGVGAAPAVLAQAGDTNNQAGVIVRFPDDTVETRCVSFSEPSITGAQLLERSGFAAVIDYNSGIGGATCSIAGQGCSYPKEDCFCQCTGSDCEYWAYYHWVDGAWQYSQVGGGDHAIGDGALEGWSWGPGNFVSGTEPPAISLAEVCAADRTDVSDQSDSTDLAGAGGAASLGQYAGFLVALAALAAAAILVRRRRA